MKIKFRGKAVGRDHWVYGYYHMAPLSIENFGMGYLATPDGKQIHCISTRFGVTREVDGETVSQYTGLNDKNGKEIYEGDIIEVNQRTLTPDKRPEARILEVKFENHTVGDFHNWEIWGFRDYSKSTYGHEVEIIGNIYENPELHNAKK